ncbi:hypothetical protein GBA52_013320 [Prunus armeniaca]|nr:hypothetical protein GBA52_013320 [Prunus armeniaca]
MQTLEFNVTSVASCFEFVLPPADQLLYESIPRKVFPPGESDSESEFLNPMSLWRRRLRKEILVPLRQALAPANQTEQWTPVTMLAWALSTTPIAVENIATSS